MTAPISGRAPSPPSPFRRHALGSSRVSRPAEVAGPRAAATAVAAAPTVVNIYTRKRLTPEPHPLCALPRFEALCRQLRERRTAAGSQALGSFLKPGASSYE